MRTCDLEGSYGSDHLPTNREQNTSRISVLYFKETRGDAKNTPMNIVFIFLVVRIYYFSI